MKRLIRITKLVCFLVALCLASANSLLAQSSCPDLVGTWEYVLEDQEGLFIGTETHGIWLIVENDRPQFESQLPTDVEKVKAFDSMVTDAFTYTCEGNKATVKFLYSKDPNVVGSGFTFEYEQDGDELTYWILNEDGSRGTEGHSRRVKN